MIVQNSVFVFSNPHVSRVFWVLSMLWDRWYRSILEAHRKIRILRACCNPSLPSHGRSWEIGFSSQLHGATSGVGFMEREYHKYPYCFNVAHFVLAWDSMVSISFWILHKLNHSMYCCWINVWGGGWRSSVFYSAICLPSLSWIYFYNNYMK